MFKINTINYCDDFMRAINVWSQSKLRNMIINRMEVLSTICHIFEKDAYNQEAIIHELSYKRNIIKNDQQVSLLAETSIAIEGIHSNDEDEDYISLISRIADKYSFNNNSKLKSMAFAYFQYILLPALSGYTEELVNTSNRKTRYHLKCCISQLFQLPESINNISITKKSFTIVDNIQKVGSTSLKVNAIITSDSISHTINEIPLIGTTTPTICPLINFKQKSSSTLTTKLTNNNTCSSSSSSHSTTTVKSCSNGASTGASNNNTSSTSNLPTLIHHHQQLLNELVSHLSSSSSSKTNNKTSSAKKSKTNHNEFSGDNHDDGDDWYGDFSATSSFNTNNIKQNKSICTKKSPTSNKKQRTASMAATSADALVANNNTTNGDDVITWIDENSMDSTCILTEGVDSSIYSPLRQQQSNAVIDNSNCNKVASTTNILSMSSSSAFKSYAYQFPMDIKKIIGAKVAQYFIVPIIENNFYCDTNNETETVGSNDRNCVNQQTEATITTAAALTECSSPVSAMKTSNNNNTNTPNNNTNQPPLTVTSATSTSATNSNSINTSINSKRSRNSTTQNRNNSKTRKKRNQKVAFIGTVTKLAPESTYLARDELYHVVWEDRDECDYNTKEFLYGMALYQKLFGDSSSGRSNSSGNIAEISKNSSSSNSCLSPIKTDNDNSHNSCTSHITNGILNTNDRIATDITDDSSSGSFLPNHISKSNDVVSDRLVATVDSASVDGEAITLDKNTEINNLNKHTTLFDTACQNSDSNNNENNINNNYY